MNCHHCSDPSTRFFFFGVLKTGSHAKSLRRADKIPCCDKDACLAAAGSSTQKTLLEKYPGEKSKLSETHAN